MAFVTQTQTTTTPSSILSSIGRFFALVGHAMAASTAKSAEARFHKIERLNAKSDAELKAMNLRREDIPAFVFRDLMHL